MADKKAIIVLGPRQAGKTTLLKALLENTEKTLWLSGDEPDVRAVFANANSTRLKALFGDNTVIVIDEAQRIEDIGLKLKLITDGIPEVKLLATGSSSFDLASKVNESLAGRKWEFMLYPFSYEELACAHGALSENRLLSQRLVFGSYPEVVTSPGDAAEILMELSGSVLYKDILAFEGIKSSTKLERLLQALSYQVGNIISYNELGQTSGMDAKTAERYIDILEKAFVVFRLGSFSRNLRNELKKSRKIYFYDNGLRNAVVADFRQLELRNDIGQLWENYLVAERKKMLSAHGIAANSFFWRTAQKQEIDLIEERNGTIRAFEFKWNPKAKATGIKSFLTAYPGVSFDIVSRDSYVDFLSGEYADCVAKRE
jgi:predicted AAA+ superfamily ATPase